MPTDISTRQLKDTSVTQPKVARDFYDLPVGTIDDTDSPYSVGAGDYLVSVDSSSAPVKIDLPALASTDDGRVLVFKDLEGISGTNSITVTPSSGDNIDTLQWPRLLWVDNAVLHLVATPSQWVIIWSFGVRALFPPDSLPVFGGPLTTDVSPDTLKLPKVSEDVFVMWEPLTGPVHPTVSDTGDNLKIEKGSNDVFSMWEPLTGPVHPTVSDTKDNLKVPKQSADAMTPPEPLTGSILGISSAKDLVEYELVMTWPVAFQAGSGVLVSGNSVTKNGGVNGAWDAGAPSYTLLTGPGDLKWTTSSNSLKVMCGLSNDDPDYSYTGIDYAHYNYNTVSFRVYENGVFKFTQGTWLPGDELMMKVDKAGHVTHWLKGVKSTYESIPAATFPLMVDCSLLNTGADVQYANLVGQNVAVPENLAVSAVVASLDTIGNPLETYSYSIVSQVPAGTYFAISGTDLVVGASGLDYETYTSHTVTIRSTDGSLNFFDTEVVIGIVDVGGF